MQHCDGTSEPYSMYVFYEILISRFLFWNMSWKTHFHFQRPVLSSESVFVIVGAGWRTTKKPGWHTTSPLWPSWRSWCSRALWCSTSFTGRFAAGRNGGRTGWLSSACGALAASSAQPGFWPSSALDPSRSSLSSYFASSTLSKVCTCWTPPHPTVAYFYYCYQACTRCSVRD